VGRNVDRECQVNMLVHQECRLVNFAGCEVGKVNVVRRVALNVLPSQTFTANICGAKRLAISEVAPTAVK
jgi:hypothetical protein